jgi:hypothetical protein
MKTFIESLLQMIGFNESTSSAVAGRCIRRAIRLITSTGVSIYYREFASLRYWSQLQPERQDLIEHGKSRGIAGESPYEKGRE